MTWGGADVILEIKCTINVMCLNHVETIPLIPSQKICLPQNPSLVPERLGTAAQGWWLFSWVREWYKWHNNFWYKALFHGDRNSELKQSNGIKVKGLKVGTKRGQHCFIFWSCHTACGILVPWPGIKRGSMAVKASSLNHWTTKKLPQIVTVQCFY